ncbi:MAG TPA: class I SAM-dependent methyltransferase [Pyrinomonadaceae bacterium]|nr:class I SAM-dependent methyltransferase [Pyrinomonadaceae bacterium]
MLPDAIQEYWPAISDSVTRPIPPALQSLIEPGDSSAKNYDQKTRANFSFEWDNHELGGDTWGMRLADRVQWFFLDSIRIPSAELRGKVMLDAGCGNGSQSVAYGALGLEVIAVDVSSGLEHGHRYRLMHEGSDPKRVHFVQADLQNPPLAQSSVDLIHSAGVLHHTPNTLKTFRALRPLLRPGGTFYVWLYKYERFVTPLVNSIRAVTTHIPAKVFKIIANVLAPAFVAFCAVVNVLGIRSYAKINRREAALALMDIFGAPYAHYHSFDEVSRWFADAGFGQVWLCNDGRRGFGVCGRLAQTAHSNNEQPSAELALGVG